MSTGEQLHNNVVLTAAQSGSLLDSLQHNQQWQRPPGAATSLAFGGKSRYLCIGDSTGAVCLWDLKKKLRVRQFFHVGKPSLQVSLDPTDTYVLSLTSQALHSYKLREGVPAKTWTPQQKNYSFTKYCTSILEPNITAIGTDDGSALLYDISDMQKSVPFFGLSRRHKGPITGIAFSHTNDKLLASASADGILQFFDKKAGSAIEQMEKVRNGISTMALHGDGVTCAVGNNSGEVILYDLRQAHQPLASMYVQGPVTSLQFSPLPKNSVPTQSNASPSAPKTNQRQFPDQQQQPQETNRMDQSTDVPPSATVRRQPSSNKFSPTAPQTQLFSQSSSNLSEEPQTSYVGALENVGRGRSNNAGSPQKSLAQYTVSTYGGVASLQPLSPQHVSSFSSPSKAATATPSDAYQGRQSQHPKPSSQRDQEQSYLVPQVNQSTVPPPTIDMEEIRDVVRDEVEKLQDDLEESLRNLHMDMIRQFHQQSQELNNALSSQMAAMDQLREENQRLREENDFLKRQHQQPQSSSYPRKHAPNHSSEMLFGN